MQFVNYNIMMTGLGCTVVSRHLFNVAVALGGLRLIEQRQDQIEPMFLKPLLERHS